MSPLYAVPPPVQVEPTPCPPWCEHPPGHPWRTDELNGMRSHDATMPGGEVFVGQVEDVQDGQPAAEPPSIWIQHESTEDLTPARAREVAAALVFAADLLDRHAR